MKSVMRMFADQDKGVVFFESVISLKPQKHTFIECVPVPWEQFDDMPGYFRVKTYTGYRTPSHTERRNPSSNRSSNGLSTRN
jgi:hypothetical protein